jgi:hypothetical protein
MVHTGPGIRLEYQEELAILISRFGKQPYPSVDPL